MGSRITTRTRRRWSHSRILGSGNQCWHLDNGFLVGHHHHQYLRRTWLRWRRVCRFHIETDYYYHLHDNGCHLCLWWRTIKWSIRWILGRPVVVQPRCFRRRVLWCLLRLCYSSFCILWYWACGFGCCGKWESPEGFTICNQASLLAYYSVSCCR